MRVEADGFVGETVDVVITPIQRPAARFNGAGPVAGGAQRVTITRLGRVHRGDAVQGIVRERALQTVWIGHVRLRPVGPLLSLWPSRQPYREEDSCAGADQEPLERVEQASLARRVQFHRTE